MVNIASKKCLHENCKKQPTFNVETNKVAIFCFDHKLENMINIISKKCQYEDCEKIPNYNLQGEKHPIYCKSHKQQIGRAHV